MAVSNKNSDQVTQAVTGKRDSRLGLAGFGGSFPISPASMDGSFSLSLCSTLLARTALPRSPANLDVFSPESLSRCACVCHSLRIHTFTKASIMSAGSPGAPYPSGAQPVSYQHAGSDPLPDPNDQNGHEPWSGDDSLDETGSRKRKRPMSVSCELCKQRKVKCWSPCHRKPRRGADAIRLEQVIEASQPAGVSHHKTCHLLLN